MFIEIFPVVIVIIPAILFAVAVKFNLELLIVRFNDVFASRATCGMVTDIVAEILEN